MDCRIISEIMMKQMDGPLAKLEAQQLRDHLKECPDCRQEHEEWQELTRMLQELPDPSPSPDFSQRVMAAIDRSLYTESQRAKERLQTGRMLVWMGLLGLVSLLVLEAAGMVQRLAMGWLQATEAYRALVIVYQQVILRSFVVSMFSQRGLLEAIPRFEPVGQWWVMLGTLNLTMFLILIKVSLDRLRSSGRGEVR